MRLNPDALSRRYPTYTNAEVEQGTTSHAKFRDPDPEAEVGDQVIGATGMVSQDPAVYLHWPWAPLDELSGGMAPGEVHFVAAFSGQGKTTFVASAVNRFVDDGKRVYVMPLELRPKVFRTILACQRLGIRPGEALSGELRARGLAFVKPLEEALRRQGTRAELERLRVCGVSRMTNAKLKECLFEAHDFSADMVLVDHIDQIEAGDGSNHYAESRLICQTALELAQQLGLKLVFTTQLNNSGAIGTDRLARFSAPRPENIKMGGHKREIASSMIGLYRPTRSPELGETAESYREKLRAARAGDVAPSEVLKRNTMGIILMKSRNYGERDGNSCQLRVWNGAVLETLPERAE